MSAIPEQTSASRKRPEEEEETVRSQLALPALRMRRGLGLRALQAEHARMEAAGCKAHADYRGARERVAADLRMRVFSLSGARCLAGRGPVSVWAGPGGWLGGARCLAGRGLVFGWAGTGVWLVVLLWTFRVRISGLQ